MAMNNRDMDSYLRRRKSTGVFSSKPSNGTSWWSGMFSGSNRRSDDLDSMEKEELMTMETDLKAREEEIEHVKEFEEELEQDQEREVSLYHKLRRFFGNAPTQEANVDDEAEFAAAEQAMAAQNTPDVQADFKELAQIQMRWLGRMPTRVMEEFKASEDFHKLGEILERRGIAKRKGGQ